MAYSPRLLGQPAKPSQIGEKLAKTWDILSPYVAGPVDAWKGLMEADLNTLLYDKGAGGRKAVEDAFNVAGTVTGGSSVVPKPSNALNMGIKAYHGSPHSFDKFEWSPRTRGTGEGAQAYGDGLYFAESEDVSGFGGTYWNQFAQRFIDKKDPEGIATFALKTAKGNRDGAISYLEGLINRSDPNSPVGKAGSDALAMLKSGQHVGPWTYEVNINADPNAFLDWDKPLSEQPEAVRKMFPKDVYGHKYDELKGSDVYESLIDDVARVRTGKTSVSSLAPSDRTGAVEMLRQAGVPGIRYLDAGSRAPARLAPQLDGLKAQLADAESKLPTAGRHTAMVLRNQIDDLKRQIAMAEQPGTRNYVVFDDKLIEIVRKYGIAGASAMLGYNILDGMDKAQADTLNKADFYYRADKFYRQGGI